MVFYKIEASFAQKEEQEPALSKQDCYELKSIVAEKSEYLFQKSEQNSIVFTLNINGNGATFVAIIKPKCNVEKEFNKYVNLLPFEIEKIKIEEITFASLRSFLATANRNGYLLDDDEILEGFEITQMTPRYSHCDFGEALISTEKSFSDIESEVDRLLFGKTMFPELSRIYEKSNVKKAYGHPVHYILRANDREVRKSIYKNLLSALYNNGRIKNQRYTFVDFDEDSSFPGATLEAIYKSSDGGTVVIRYTQEDDKDGEFGRRGRDMIAAICEIAVKYKQKVLTIICLSKDSNEIKDEFLSNWNHTAFVELYEDVVFGEKACSYLKNKARDNKIRPDKKLLGQIIEDKGYVATELNSIFDNWHQKKLCNEIYPQYKTVNTVKAKIKEEKPRGQAYKNLQNLIGLEEAKAVMERALNYFKAQKLFSDKGLKNERPSMHMVFTGNPGTAKTTVARIFAEVMKENGLLPSGNIYEVGRADLVGRYVGHTAPLVKAAFRRARGGVLFIDEAYSLVDDRDGLFGDEAINTIVQEMENNRKDTIVIFAGYPDKMENFLNKNPGLRSRIAFHIPFEDYNANELCDIAQLIAKEDGFIIADGAKEKLISIFDEATKSSDFGNGRYARNVIEKAKMAQANRLVNMDFDAIDDEAIFTLTVNDFEIPSKAKEKVIKIGFCA